MERKCTVYYKGGKDVYTFPFSYLRKEFVKVRYFTSTESHELTYSVDYTVEERTLKLKEAIGEDFTICIYRQTSSNQIVKYNDGSFLLASELNTADIQMLHLAEEQSDYLITNAMSYSEDKQGWDAQGKRIVTVADPVEEQDVVSLHYLDSVGVARQEEISRIEQSVTEKHDTVVSDTARVEEALQEVLKNTKTTNENAEKTESDRKTTEDNVEQSEALKADVMQLSKQVTEDKSDVHVTAENSRQLLDAVNPPWNIRMARHTYEVGDIAYSPLLKSYQRLECVVGGTTADTDIDLASSTTGGAVVDGSCTWLLTDVRDGTPVGAVRGSLYVPPGYTKANGATVQRADYPRLVRLADEYNLWTDDTNIARGRFGRGDGSTTFVLPNWTGLFEQFADTEAGQYVEAGLPNIEGWFMESSDGNTKVDEVLFTRQLVGSPWVRGGDGGGRWRFNFDASKFNPIYGNSTTVQPPAMRMIPIIRY